jgi:hypothetical protein
VFGIFELLCLDLRVVFCSFDCIVFELDRESCFILWTPLYLDLTCFVLLTVFYLDIVSVVFCVLLE